MLQSPACVESWEHGCSSQGCRDKAWWSVGCSSFFWQQVEPTSWALGGGCQPVPTHSSSLQSCQKLLGNSTSCAAAGGLTRDHGKRGFALWETQHQLQLWVTGHPFPLASLRVCKCAAAKFWGVANWHSEPGLPYPAQFRKTCRSLKPAVPNRSKYMLMGESRAQMGGRGGLPWLRLEKRKEVFLSKAECRVPAEEEAPAQPFGRKARVEGGPGKRTLLVLGLPGGSRQHGALQSHPTMPLMPPPLSPLKT